MVSYALFIPMLSVLVGLVWRKPWRQPYTCEMLSDVNSSSIKVIVPQGQIPASYSTYVCICMHTMNTHYLFDTKKN